MYGEGRGGLPKDMTPAMAFYRLAADQGNQYAINALARLQAPASVSQATNLRDPTPSIASAARQPSQFAFGGQYALIIANKNYLYLKSLDTPHADAELVRRALWQYGFADANIKVLRDAKRADITQELSALRARLTKVDNLLIYYAGHGRIDNLTERGYWLPVDAQNSNEGNWVSNDDITNYLRGMAARSVLVVADSCYSGTLTRVSSMTPLAAGGLDEWLRRMASRRSRTALTSGGLEPVLDGGGAGNSVFARAFAEVLQSNQQAHAMHDLYSAIARKVALNASQTVNYGDIRLAGHEDGDFVFVPR
jgi:hypothetical protein